MFTGLVQAVGRVAVVERWPEGMRLGVDVGSWDYRKRARTGDSVCVAGVCLTVVGSRRARPGVFMFDVVRETLDKTGLGTLRVGERVNLEHAATSSTFLGGHIVQGHVDGVGRVAKVQDGEDWRVWIDLPRELRKWVVSKGSVCVEGVSLTVAGETARGIWVALIPETLARTTLGSVEAGDTVNVECDVIGKMIVAAVEREMGRRKRKRK